MKIRNWKPVDVFFLSKLLAHTLKEIYHEAHEGHEVEFVTLRDLRALRGKFFPLDHVPD